MNRTNLSDSELAALAARIQQNYNYDDRSGKLVNAKTNRVVRGEKHCKRNGKHRYLSMRAYINGQRHHILMHRVVWAWHNGCFPTMQLAYINGVSEALFKVGMCLPAGPYVSDDDVQHIVRSIKAAVCD